MVLAGIIASAGKFAAQVQQLASKGVGADRIFRIVREFAKLGKGDKSPLPRSKVRRIVGAFREDIAVKSRLLPALRSKRLTTNMAVQTEFRSPLDFRYLLEFDFKVRNPLTGQIKTIRNTIGFRRLDRLGVFEDQAKARIASFNAEEKGFYLPIGFEGLPDTVAFVSLFRTLNN